MKRLFDVFFSSVGLLLMLPLFALIAILINRESAGKVFFIQKRMGKNYKPFDLLKFRTMVSDAPKKGLSITAGDDPRITKIGKIIRKIKLDELPQLWNVLKGDMSLVGPRPEVETYVNRYKSDYKEILKVRPGMTDIASLRYADEETILTSKKDPEDYYIQVLLPKKILLAKEYIRKASLLYDFKLIVLTIVRLVFQKKASQ